MNIKENKSKKIAIFGCSGFALEVADICYKLDYDEIVLLSNEDDGLVEINSLPVMKENEASFLNSNGFEFAIGIGSAQTRENIFKEYKDFSFPNLIHPSAEFGLNQERKFKNTRGNIITAGVIFTNSITVGNFGLYNLNVTIGHDCVIEDFVSIMPNVTVSGNVHLCEKVFLGASATLLQGSNQKKLIVGKGATVGAASLVTKSVAEDVVVFGIPAKIFGPKGRK